MTRRVVNPGCVIGLTIALLVISVTTACGQGNDCPSNGRSGTICITGTGNAVNVPATTSALDLSQAPPSHADQTPVETATLAAATAPTQTYLVDLTPTATNYGVNGDTAPINGHPYSHSYAVTAGCGDPTYFWEWNLGRSYTALHTAIGVADTASYPSELYQFEVFVDGVSRARQQVGFGQDPTMDVDLRGGLRLKLAITAVSGGDACDSLAVYGEPVLYGGPAS
jgi:hypothetical protein